MTDVSKNILITGSGGFIGQNIKEYLLDKYTLFCPRSSELDLLDKKDVEQYFEANQINFVIHCANKGGAKDVVDDESVITDNLKMFNTLIDCLNGNRMIFFGSGAQYCKNRELSKVREEDFAKFVPKDHYGLSKYKIVEKIQNLENVLCLNIFGCYGKYEKSNRFPSYAITQNLNKEPITINQNVVFDYIYIDGLCKIVHYFIENQPKTNIINATPTESIDLVTISKIVNELSDFKSEIIVKSTNLNYEYTGDNSLLLKEINELSFTSYKSGLSALKEHLSKSRQ